MRRPDVALSRATEIQAGRWPRHRVPRGHESAVRIPHEQDIELDLDAPNAGWSDLGRFRFASDAEVRLLDVGDGMIVADAVRFQQETP